MNWFSKKIREQAKKDNAEFLEMEKRVAKLWDSLPPEISHFFNGLLDERFEYGEKRYKQGSLWGFFMGVSLTLFLLNIYRIWLKM